LCTDKTGTLTEATIKLVHAIDGYGAESARAYAYAHVNSRFESGMKSPLDEAILSARPFDISGWKKIDEVPFDFERRRVSVLVEHDAKRRLIVKGAPEDLLRLCGQYEDAGGATQPLLTRKHAGRSRRPSTRSVRKGFAHWVSPGVWSMAVTRPRR
jgi:Mg2+-importing ATPase